MHSRPSIVIILLCVSSLFHACVSSFKYSYEEDNKPLYEGDFRTSFGALDSTLKSIKVVCFNIEFAKNVEGAKTLLNQDPLNSADVILLQEMDEKGTEALAKQLHLNYIYYPAIYHPGQQKNVGNAILTKWDIRNTKKLKLPHPSDYFIFFDGRKYNFRKTATIAEIEIHGSFITFASTHAAAFNTTQKRREFAKAIVDDIDHSSGTMAIVGGDFNSLGRADIDATAGPFINAGYQWASKDIGMTVSEKKSILKTVPSGAFQLDHLFVKGLKIQNTGKVDQTGVSDHLPIWAELKIIEE